MSPFVIVGVALAGGLGAVCRYVLDCVIRQWARRVGARGAGAWGTWVVNVTGSLAAGLLVGAALRRDLPAEVVLVVGGGFLGAYTTFSTWIHESLRLIETRGAWHLAAINLFGSIITGTIAAAAGLQAARLIT